MKVYTYFAEHATAKGGQVIELWKRSWQRAGFDPRVLRRGDAEKHPRYQSVLDRVRKFPSANSQWYEVACYLRWLAMATVDGGGLHVDWDLINLGEPPWELGDKFTDWGIQYEGPYLPAFVSGSRADFEQVIDWFFLPPPIQQEKGTRHVSDMLFFTNYGPRYMHVANPRRACALLGRGEEKIIHCSSRECVGLMKTTKYAVINKLVTGKVSLETMRDNHCRPPFVKAR